jgi:hypothetical protein
MTPGFIDLWATSLSAGLLVDIQIIVGLVDLTFVIHSMVQEQRVVLGNLLAFLSVRKE